ncbi:hypothetical protein A9Q94_13550 [Rhodobacterales bacterium 56_14_T64]|nr:hypothetical protein A9Q94_13550 [Rhodobacterales bacterium 56_14_T64]
MFLQFSRTLLFGAAFLISPQLTHAQGADLALAEAKTRLVCGTGTPIAAEYLPGGLLQVTCRKNLPRDTLPDALQGTGLTVTTEIGLIAAIAVISVIAGNNSVSTTTSMSGY